MVTPLWQLSVSCPHMVKSLTLNPYMSLCNLKLCTHIWSTNINFRPPLHCTFWSILVWTFTLWVNCGRGEGVGPSTRFFITDRNVTTWVAPPRSNVRETRLKNGNFCMHAVWLQRQLRTRIMLALIYILFFCVTTHLLWQILPCYIFLLTLM